MASRAIWDEYVEQASKQSVLALFARHGVDKAEFHDLLLQLLQIAEVVTPEGDPPPCRDPDDRKYLHCAVFAGVRWMVTRDKDLLDEDSRIPTVSIVTPEVFLERLGEAGPDLDA